jgi:hypothetical protein
MAAEVLDEVLARRASTPIPASQSWASATRS